MPFTRRACDVCDKKKSSAINPYVYRLIRLRNLQRGGYPFSKNDLDYQTWIDLGTLNDMLDSRIKIMG